MAQIHAYLDFPNHTSHKRMRDQDPEIFMDLHHDLKKVRTA